MKITVGKLKRVIRGALGESGWANYSRNALSPETDDRPAIEKMSLKDLDGEQELASHLLDAERTPETDEEMWGPVPPRKDQDVFYPQSDPYTNDYNVIPTPAGSAGR